MGIWWKGPWGCDGGKGGGSQRAVWKCVECLRCVVDGSILFCFVARSGADLGKVPAPTRLRANRGETWAGGDEVVLCLIGKADEAGLGWRGGQGG